VTPELVYVLENGKTLKALNPANGKARWQAPLSTCLPLTLAEGLIIGVTEHTAIALNRWNGKRVWEFDPRPFGDWKLDGDTVPVTAPGRVLLPSGNTLIGLDIATGQPAWAYTVTAAKPPLQPVVIDDTVYVRLDEEDTEIRLSLADGLPDTGEHILPPEIEYAIKKVRKAAQKPVPVTRPSSAGGSKPFVAVKATVAPGGKALAAAGAKRWRFPAPAGWKIDGIAGESAGHLYALLGAGTSPAAPKPNKNAAP
jgi:outer membrane protein assembly factor BamB